MTVDIKKVQIGDLETFLISDKENGEILDTKVEIKAGAVCVVSGSERDQFITELNEVIKKYRI